MDNSIITFASQKEWEEYLSKNFNKQDGIWVRFYKVDSGLKTFSYDEALETALCYGWIDGQVKKYDDKSYIQRFTPRRKRSMWSERNKGIVEHLTEAGRMKPSGLAEVERAKTDGRWENSYASPANMKVPKDFEEALSKNKKADDFWEKLNKTNRYAMLFQIHNAKREETRVRRIEKFISMLERGEKLY